MPMYAYQCPECEHAFDEMQKLANFDDPMPCPECKHEACPRQVTKVNFNLPGDGWASKNGRISGQMTKRLQSRNARVEAKKREEPLMNLVPNVEGLETGTWKEAQKFAKSVGKDSRTYDKMVSKEEVAKSK